jgi:hypothetical protein
LRFLQVVQVFADDSYHQIVVGSYVPRLNEQTFLKISRGHAGRVEFLHAGALFPRTLP